MTDNEKLRHWLNDGPCTYWSLHMFEYGLIVKSLEHFNKSFDMNPIARQVYDHLMETILTSDLPVVLPTPETLDQYMREGGKYVESKSKARNRRKNEEEELWDEV